MPKRKRPRYPVDLPADSILLLRNAEYDDPVLVRGRWKKVAEDLIARGFLERDPSASAMVVRRTLYGAEEAKPLTRREVEAIVAYIAGLRATGQFRLANGLERSLWYRIIVESTLGFVNGAILRASVKHV